MTLDLKVPMWKNKMQRTSGKGNVCLKIYEDYYDWKVDLSAGEANIDYRRMNINIWNTNHVYKPVINTFGLVHNSNKDSAVRMGCKLFPARCEVWLLHYICQLYQIPSYM